MKVNHADPLDDPLFMDSLSERNAALVKCSPKIERCAFWAVAHGANAFELLDILQQLGLDVATWQNEPWHTTPLAMLFDGYVANLRLVKLEQVLGPAIATSLATLLESKNVNAHKRSAPPTSEQMAAIAQLSSECRKRCPDLGEASLDEMATAVADTIEL